MQCALRLVAGLHFSPAWYFCGVHFTYDNFVRKLTSLWVLQLAPEGLRRLESTIPRAAVVFLLSLVSWASASGTEGDTR